jgi:hypothetical protein
MIADRRAGRLQGVKLLYKPFGIVAGIVGKRAGRRLFAAIWERVDGGEPPRPSAERATWHRAVGAAALQAAALAAARTAADRAGRRTFAHLFGVWPGERER